jgi:hypothetical protein
MKSILLLLATSISLLTANAAPDAAPKPPTPIASLPIKITAAGSYYFISNMFYTPTSLSDSTAITINSPGNVMIDLKGYTLTGPPQVFVGGFYLNPSGIVILSSNVTIKNGTIAGFTYQISANPNTGQPPNYISNIDIKSITFTGGLFNTLQLTFVNNSLVRDCTFTESNSTAIVDGRSQTGNRYINDLFSGTQVNPIQMRSDAPIIVHRITPLQKNDED